MLPGPKCCGCDGDVLGLPDGAGHVVGQVVARLYVLTELDYHHVGKGVSVLQKCKDKNVQGANKRD